MTGRRLTREWPLLLVGAGAGAVTVRLASRAPSGVSSSRFGTALVGCCAVYPLARHRLDRGPVLLELASVACGGAVLSAARRRPPRSALLVVAAGWAAHGAFDLLHQRGEGSLVPAWYPSVCAGYDVGLATMLLMDDRSGDRDR